MTKDNQDERRKKEFYWLLRTLEREDDESGKVTNSMLKLFFRGLPLDHIRILLRGNTRLKRAGAWIASELGRQGQPLLHDIRPLLEDEDLQVRFDAIDALLTKISVQDADVVLDVLQKLDDQDSAVRWKAMFFASRVRTDVLEAARSRLAIQPALQPPRASEGLDLVLGVHAEEELLALIHASDKLLSKYAMIGLARRSGRLQYHAQVLTSVDDSDLRQFARDVAELDGGG